MLRYPAGRTHKLLGRVWLSPCFSHSGFLTFPLELCSDDWGGSKGPWSHSPHCWSIPVPRQGASGVGGTLSPSSDGCAVPGTAADPWVWLRCRGKKLSLTPAFASLLQTLARQREGGRDGNPSQPLVLLKLKVREPRELKGVRSRQAVTTPEFRMALEKNPMSLRG